MTKKQPSASTADISFAPEVHLTVQETHHIDNVSEISESFDYEVQSIRATHQLTEAKFIQEVQPQESEKPTFDSFEKNERFAEKTVDLIESLEIRQTAAIESDSPLTEFILPNTCTVDQERTTLHALQSEETLTLDTVGSKIESIPSASVIKIELPNNLHETVIQETILAETTENDIKHDQSLEATAFENVLPQSSLSVHELQAFTNEEPLAQTRISFAESKIKIDSIEPLIIEETHPEHQPSMLEEGTILDKTHASEIIVPHIRQTTEFIDSSEKEGICVHDKTPASQKVELDVISDMKTTLVTEYTVHESELSFTGDRLAVSEATPKIDTLESISVSKTDEQEEQPQFLFAEPIDHRKATINLSDNSKVVTSKLETISAEKETDLTVSDVPTVKTAGTSVSSLEITCVSSTSVQESAADLLLSKSPTEYSAEVSIPALESITTSETVAENDTEEFYGTFTPNKQEITPSVCTLEKIIVSQIQTSLDSTQQVDMGQLIDNQQVTADVILDTQEASSIIEVTINQDEYPFETDTSPQTAKADQKMTTHTSLNITEVQPDATGDEFTVSKVIEAKPKIELQPVEPLFIEETMTQTMADSFTPETFKQYDVTTDICLPNHVQPVTQITTLPEKEETLLVDRKPTEQNVAVTISSLTETAVKHENMLHETENTLVLDKPLQTVAAAEIIDTLKSISVSTVEEEMKETNLTIESDKSVAPSYSTIETISPLSVTEIVLSEKVTDDGKVKEQPKTGTARESFDTLEVSTTTHDIAQESSVEYTPESIPAKTNAETTMIPQKHYTTSELNISDDLTDVRSTGPHKEEKATFNLDTRESKIIQEIQVHEREETTESPTQPDEKTVQPVFDELKGVQIMQHTMIEKESGLVTENVPELQESTVTESYIKPLLVEQVQAVESLDILDTPKQQQQKVKITSVDDHKSTTVEETIAVESSIQYEKQKSPVEIQARPDLTRTDEVAINEEVYSEESITPSVNTEVPSKQKAKFTEDVQHSTIVTEHSTTAEMESQLPDTVKPFSKLVNITFESDTLKTAIGKIYHFFETTIKYKQIFH